MNSGSTRPSRAKLKGSRCQIRKNQSISLQGNARTEVKHHLQRELRIYLERLPDNGDSGAKKRKRSNSQSRSSVVTQSPVTRVQGNEHVPGQRMNENESRDSWIRRAHSAILQDFDDDSKAINSKEFTFHIVKEYPGNRDDGRRDTHSKTSAENMTVDAPRSTSISNDDANNEMEDEVKRPSNPKEDGDIDNHTTNSTFTQNVDDNIGMIYEKSVATPVLKEIPDGQSAEEGGVHVSSLKENVLGNAPKNSERSADVAERTNESIEGPPSAKGCNRDGNSSGFDETTPIIASFGDEDLWINPGEDTFSTLQYALEYGGGSEGSIPEKNSPSLHSEDIDTNTRVNYNSIEIIDIVADLSNITEEPLLENLNADVEEELACNVMESGSTLWLPLHLPSPQFDDDQNAPKILAVASVPLSLEEHNINLGSHTPGSIHTKDQKEIDPPAESDPTAETGSSPGSDRQQMIMNPRTESDSRGLKDLQFYDSSDSESGSEHDDSCASEVDESDLEEREDDPREENNADVGRVDGESVGDTFDKESIDDLRNDDALRPELPELSGMLNSTSRLSATSSDNRIQDPDFSAILPPSPERNNASSHRSVVNVAADPNLMPNFDDRGIENVSGRDGISSTKSCKKTCCPYCLKDQTKLKRHLIDVHSKEADVIKMILETKKNPGSRGPLEKLAARGEELRNTRADILKDGDLRVAKAPKASSGRTPEDYIICPTCRKIILQESYRKHRIRHDERADGGHHLLVKARATFLQCHPEASERMRTLIFPPMRRDAVVRAIRWDKGIVLFGNQESNHLRGEDDVYQIRVMLRRLGRLKLTVCKITNQDPKKTDMIKLILVCPALEFIKGIEMMANDNKLGEQYLRHPTVAQNMFTLMKGLCENIAVHFIDLRDTEQSTMVDNFVRSLRVGYRTQLSRAAAESHSMHRRHRVEALPATDEIKTFLKYLADVRIKNYNILVEKLCLQAFRILLKATMASLQVFNRRRPGDVERISWADYDAKTQMNTVPAFNTLDGNLQDIANEFSLLSTRGKLGRTVKLLVPGDVKMCLEKIREVRLLFGVSEKNDYMFGLPVSGGRTTMHLKAYVVLRQFAKDSGLENNQLLNATRLRKQLATACVELDLNDAGLTDLARYMGHHPDVHRSVYRQGITNRDIPLFLGFVQTALGVTNKKPRAPQNPSLENSSQNSSTQEQSTVSPDHEPQEPIGDEILPGPSATISRGSQKILWTDQEKTLARSVFKEYLTSNGKAPSLGTCRQFIEANAPIVNQNRAAAGVKTWLACERNRIRKS